MKFDNIALVANFIAAVKSTYRPVDYNDHFKTCELDIPDEGTQIFPLRFHKDHEIQFILYRGVEQYGVVHEYYIKSFNTMEEAIVYMEKKTDEILFGEL